MFHVNPLLDRGFTLTSSLILNRLDVSCESSAGQRIRMKHQALFPSKDRSKKIKVFAAAFFCLAL